MDSHNNFANMVLKQDATRGLIAAAQVLHSKVFNLVPLQELCMRTIAVNLPKFSAVPQLIDCLPPRLKSDILHNLQVMASYKSSNASLFYVERAVQVPARGNSSSSLKLKKRESGCSAPNAVIPSSILLRLINSTLTKFDFTLCGISQQLFKSNGLDKQILQLFAENPEGITSIVDQRILRYGGRDIQLPAGSCIIEYLEKLTNLKHLDLPTKFNDDDLERLSKGCRQLKSVNLGYSTALTIKGLQILSTLPHLEKITVSPFSRGSTKHSNFDYQDAINLIPHLKEIALETPFHFDYLDIRGQTYGFERFHTLLDGCTDQLPTCLPNLKEVVISDAELQFHGSSYTFDDVVPSPIILIQLPLLTALTVIDNVNSGEVARSYLDRADFVLSGLSVRLTRLTLQCYEGDMDLFGIVLLCPNLVFLEVLGVFNQNFQTDSNNINPQLLKLEELRLEYTSRAQASNQANFFKLLLAPRLHTVCLIDVFISPEDSVEPFLQNLVHFDSSCQFALPARLPLPEVYVRHVTFLKNIVLNCPKLETSKFYVHHEVFILANFEDYSLLSSTLDIELMDVSPKFRCNFSVKSFL